MAKSEEFKRPHHPDFMNVKELKELGFTGVRHNTFARDFEFWANGEMRKRIHENVVRRDPSKMIKMHLEVYGFIPPDESGIILPQTKGN